MIFKVLRQALDTYGRSHQLNKAKEELAELIVAISRVEDGRDTRDQIIEELADVCVISGTLQLIYNITSDEVKDQVMSKIERLKTRMDHD